MQAQKDGESIEGLKIHGYPQDNDVCEYRRTEVFSGIECKIFKFKDKGSKDVYAEIVDGLNGKPQIDVNAFINVGDNLKSRTALVITPTIQEQRRRLPRWIDFFKDICINKKTQWESLQQTNVKVWNESV
jgi:hypothetical protein